MLSLTRSRCLFRIFFKGPLSNAVPKPKIPLAPMTIAHILCTYDKSISTWSSLSSSTMRETCEMIPQDKKPGGTGWQAWNRNDRWALFVFVVFVIGYTVLGGYVWYAEKHDNGDETTFTGTDLNTKVGSRDTSSTDLSKFVTSGSIGSSPAELGFVGKISGFSCVLLVSRPSSVLYCCL